MGACRKRAGARVDHGTRAGTQEGGRPSAQRDNALCNGGAAMESCGVVDRASAAAGPGSRLRLAGIEARVRSTDVRSAVTGGWIAGSRLQATYSGALAAAIIAGGAAADHYRRAPVRPAARGTSGPGGSDSDCHGGVHAGAGRSALQAGRPGVTGTDIG